MADTTFYYMGDNMVIIQQVSVSCVQNGQFKYTRLYKAAKIIEC